MTNFASSNPHLCSNLDRPNYCHDNPYILNGYRKPGGTTAAKYLNQTLAHSRKTSNNVHTPPEKRRRTLSTHSECQDPLSPLDEDLNSQETGGLILEKGHTKIRPPRSIFKASEALEVNTYLKSLKSLAYWHNESINIHTHLWGSVISIIILSLHLLAYFSLLPTSLLPFTHHSIFLPPVLKTSSRLSRIFSLSLQATQMGNDVSAEQIWERGNDWKDILSFASYLLAAGACFACSAAFHTCQCISKDVARRFQKLDYLGIVILAAGSYLPTLHYGFFCHPNHFSIYIMSVSILALGCLWVTFDPLWATPAYRPYRTSVFIALGLSALGPTYHMASIYGSETLTYTMGFEYLAASGIIYILGACIYVLQAPERFLPGRFDYIGSSHQIFHTFILIAAFLQYVAVRRSYHFWSTVEVLSEIQSQNPQWFGKEMICKVLESSSSSSATSY